MIGMEKSLAQAVKEAAEQLARSITSSLSSTDRQRVNIGSTSVLYHGVLASTSWVELFESSVNSRTEIREWHMANNEVSANVVTIAIVPKGETVSDNHLFYPKITVPAQDSITRATNTSLMSEWKVYARAASSNRIVLHISGTEIMN